MPCPCCKYTLVPTRPQVEHAGLMTHTIESHLSPERHTIIGLQIRRNDQTAGTHISWHCIHLTAPLLYAVVGMPFPSNHYSLKHTSSSHPSHFSQANTIAVICIVHHELWSKADQLICQVSGTSPGKWLPWHHVIQWCVPLRPNYRKSRDYDVLDKRKTVTALRAGEDRAILLGLGMVLVSFMMYFVLAITVLRSYSDR
jgi:hypothetical protein